MLRANIYVNGTYDANQCTTSTINNPCSDRSADTQTHAHIYNANSENLCQWNIRCRGVWCSNSVQGPNGVCLWKRIRKGDTFYHFVNFKAGDDSSIKFWRDPWCGGLPLKDNFPELYGFACNSDASVADLLSLLVDSYHWNVSFVKPAQDWELELVVSFMDLIYFGLRKN